MFLLFFAGVSILWYFIYYILLYNMKDKGRKIICSIIAFWWLATLWIYMYRWMPLVKDYVAQYNYYILAALGLLFIVFFLQFGLVLLHGKWLKVRAIVIWLAVILIWYYFINNDASRGIYAGDIITLIWVLMIYLSLVWVIVTKQAEKKQALKKQVIIEV